MDQHPLESLKYFLRIKKYQYAKYFLPKANVVIYTAIAGDYDDLISHTYLSPTWDYVCFTDSSVRKPHVWSIRPMSTFDHPEPVRKAKFYKMFPDILFPEYDFSIWVDGSIDIKDSCLVEIVEKLISKNDFLMGVSPHSQRNCIYDEANECIRIGKDQADIIRKQIAFFREKQYPDNAGLFEAGILVRKHSDPKVRNVMQDWWDMIVHGSKRDQLSLNYVLWKNNLKTDMLFPSQKYSFMHNSSFIVRPHKK